MSKPTGQQLFDAWYEEEADGIEFVTEECEPDDHGYSWTRIFKRLSDYTFWSCYGVNQSSGDYDTLRDDFDTIDIMQVYPQEVTTVVYRTVQS